MNNDDVTPTKLAPDWWKSIEGKSLEHDDVEEENILMHSYKANVKGYNVPAHGWKIALSHKFQFSPTYWTLPPLSQISSCLGLSVRYLKYYVKLYGKKKRPCMDFFNQTKLRPIYGVPLGGIGCGTINRGWRGDLCRWQLKPGSYTYDIPAADQFIVNIRRRGVTVWQQVLNPGAPTNGELKTWNWNYDGTQAYYTGLYPRAWTVYYIESQNITLTCRQISPVFPHNYKDTSLPVGVFVWNIENGGDEDVQVTICMCMENGNGCSTDVKKISGLTNEIFTKEDCCGVQMNNSSQYPAMPYTINIATARKEGISTSQLLSFNPTSNGADLWKPLLDDGCFPPVSESRNTVEEESSRVKIKKKKKSRKRRAERNDCFRGRSKIYRNEGEGNRLDADDEGSASPGVSEPTKKGERIASAITATSTIPSNSILHHSIDFALSWDMPKIHFGDKGKTYARRYTRFYGDDGKKGAIIASYALHNYTEWEQEIEKWQQPILDNPQLPAWYKSAIFNELYYISDGGTVWVETECDVIEDNTSSYAQVPQETRHIAEKIRNLEICKEYGRFAYLEGHEYKMYNTYDVHFYASTALAQLWPNLELSLQSDFAIAILQSEKESRQYLMDGKFAPAKTKNVVPHDLGCPDDEPWLNINTYFVHDTAEWKDLNPKFVLQIFRDYHITKNLSFLQAIYPVCKIIMEESLKYDKDNDGMIENSGGADQTFDGWSVTGVSAYCGGLWLAALRSMKEAGKILELDEDVEYYTNILSSATTSYQDNLWNGKYYNYDSSKNIQHRTSIMADQCAGQWFLSTSNIADVLPQEQILSALSTVYEYNVKKYDNGKHGAVNGMTSSGEIDVSSVQSDEVWTGVTYSLSATMIHQGMLKEGFHTASGIYRSSWQRYGMAYQTPEAFRKNKTYRSLGYMRPLSIWGIQYAIEHPHAT